MPFTLDDKQGQQVMQILATTKDWPWTVTNPLLMALGQQQAAQAQQQQQSQSAMPGPIRPSNGDATINEARDG